MKVDNLQVAGVVFALGIIVLCCALVRQLSAAGHINNRTAQLDKNNGMEVNGINDFKYLILFQKKNSKQFPSGSECKRLICKSSLRLAERSH